MVWENNIKMDLHSVPQQTCRWNSVPKVVQSLGVTKRNVLAPEPATTKTFSAI